MDFELKVLILQEKRRRNKIRYYRLKNYQVIQRLEKKSARLSQFLSPDTTGEEIDEIYKIQDQLNYLRGHR